MIGEPLLPGRKRKKKRTPLFEDYIISRDLPSKQINNKQPPGLSNVENEENNEILRTHTSAS